MLGIGLYAYHKSTDDLPGFLLGGRQLSAPVTALSAGASDMSGWVLMGLPGAVFVSGLSNSWIAIGLIIGALLNYVLLAPRLRIYTEFADNALTIPDYLEKRFSDHKHYLRMLAAGVIIVFFTLYCASGLVAAARLFENVFVIEYKHGLYITASVVCIYTLFGGFLAVSLTDFIQGCLMFIALLLVPLVTYNEFANHKEFVSYIVQVDSNLYNWIGELSFVAVLSSLAWGLGYFGQPHIITRFMAIRSVKDINKARNIGMSWMLVTLIGAIATGLCGIAYAQKYQYSLNDSETIFMVLSQLLFHPVIFGFLITAILAAIMSTISSQLLVSSSSLADDVYKVFLRKKASQEELVMAGRISVASVAIAAAVIAYFNQSPILSLVGHAWAGFGAAFGPTILFSLFSVHMTKQAAFSGIITGALTVLFWLYAPVSVNGFALPELIYEIIPGFLLSSLAIVITIRFGQAPSHETKGKFRQFEELHKHMLIDK